MYDNLPSFIRKEDIRKKADDFFKQYNPTGICPLDILKIAELSLGLYIIPQKGLKLTIDTEAYLTSDCCELWVDLDTFENARFENRLRFSVAHEIGHLILHRGFLEMFHPQNESDYISAIQSIPADKFNSIEYQANEFAGRLLVPVDLLRIELEKLRPYIKQFRMTFPESPIEDIIPYISTVVAPVFGVAPKTIELRVKYEKVDI